MKIHAPAAVTVRSLRFAYSDSEALRDVSFVIEPGRRVGLIGPNGAGKSTLLLHLNGLLPERPPSRPAVWIGEEPVTHDTLHSIRRRVGLLFQDPNDQLFGNTVLDDVSFGPRQLGHDEEEVRRIARACLARVGLAHLEQRPPYHLSVGEKRRACLAGVLACEPSVLVLDEPTSNLDPRGRRELLAVLKSIEVTQLIATHDLEFVAQLCERVIVLDGGVVTADGPMAEILGNEALMLAHGLERPHILDHHHPHTLRD